MKAQRAKRKEYQMKYFKYNLSICERVHTRESHVSHDITLSALHRRHALEEELATDEAHGGEKTEDPNGIAIFTGHAIVVIQTVLLAILLYPALGGYAAEDHNGEELKMNKKFIISNKLLVDIFIADTVESDSNTSLPHWNILYNIKMFRYGLYVC